MKELFSAQREFEREELSTFTHLPSSKELCVAPSPSFICTSTLQLAKRQGLVKIMQQTSLLSIDLKPGFANLHQTL